jgi:putative molybdopterin biosynthesis protein
MKIFLTIDEVSKTLNLSKMTIYRYINAGKLPAYKFGREFRIEPKDFDDFLKENKIKIDISANE